MAFELVAKLCTLQREYLLWKSTKSLAFLRQWRLNLLREIVHIATGILVIPVNVLTNSVKISDQTNADFFQLNIFQMHGKIG